MFTLSHFKYFAAAFIAVICVSRAMDTPLQSFDLQKKLLNELLEQYSDNSLKGRLNQITTEAIINFIRRYPRLAQEEIERGDSLLIRLATFSMYEPLVQRLFDSNIPMNVNFINAQRNTPLLIAARNARSNMVKLLIEHDATIDDQSSSGFTPLMEAISHLKPQFSQWYQSSISDYLKIIRLLLIAGADPTLRNRRGETAFDLAANNPQVLALLNEYGKKKIK